MNNTSSCIQQIQFSNENQRHTSSLSSTEHQSELSDVNPCPEAL